MSDVARAYRDSLRILRAHLNAGATRLTLRAPSGATREVAAVLYQPSGQELAALGQAGWSLDGGMLWLMIPTIGEPATAAGTVARGDVFDYNGALWEVQGAPIATPDAAGARALAVMKERL